MNDSPLICFCMSVSKEEILTAISEGNHTLDSLKKKLSCCTGCGTCEPRVRKILDEKLAEIAATKK